ncbi:MAG: DUF1538 domain-containing protein [Firmicutes bacterium]|nr:DUF1538 domain-containing protein [Bacillota bacterium]
MLKLLLEKFKESSQSVIPIIILVAVLNFTIAKLSNWSFVLFLVSSVLMIIGIALFNLGVDISLIPIGEHIGSTLVKSRNLVLIVILTFVVGCFVTVAEPDLALLAAQITGVPDAAIIAAVAIGVGLALVGAFLRILFQWRLSYILIGCYVLAFILSGFTNTNFLSIAWESGAVTTGPIMVPFVMALGLGLASVRGDKASEEDSFGLVALTLIGPILAVLILGMFFTPAGESNLAIPELQSFKDIVSLYLRGTPEYFSQVAIALFPILLVFAIFQVLKLKLKRKAILQIIAGTVYTFFGLVIFLASANLGFMPAGYALGSAMINNAHWVLLILVGFAMGYFVVAAEPAVFVLKRQVDEVTAGAISPKSMGLGLSIGVGTSVALAMVRVLTGWSLFYFVLLGYGLVIILTFLAPRLFTSIAFDSGAVASGPLAATFMLPFAIGASETLGGNIFTDAFGIVALVALTPVIVLLIFGVAFNIRARKAAKEMAVPAEDTIIELDYVAEAPDANETPE